MMNLLKTFDINNIESYSENELSKMLDYLNKKYHVEGKSIVSDEIFDFIHDFVKEKFPQNNSIRQVGGIYKSFVQLPFYMGSMDKIKNNENDLQKWKIQNNSSSVVISDKLDGVSALLIKNENNIQCFTRGNGSKGQDISNLFKHLNNSQKIFETKFNGVLRGELIINKDSFYKIKDSASNPRNTVSGIVNAKNPNMEILSQIDFVAYEILNQNLKPSEQMSLIKEFNLDCVNYSIIENISILNLKNILISRKSNSIYEIDGIVVVNNIPYKPISSGNPKNAFAFKQDFDEAKVIVTDVIWNLSKDSYLIPTVIFDSVKINNVDVKKATGFNAKFIHDNKINIGSELLVTRSGEVVPFIKKVLTFSNVPKMPCGNFSWNESNVHIKINDKMSLQLKSFQYLVGTLNIKGVSDSISKRLFHHGINTLKKIFSVTREELLKVEGIQLKSANNILVSIDNTKNNLTCESLMVASNCFGRGFGPEYAKSIVKNFPDFLTKSPSIEQLIAIDGIDTITATRIYNNFTTFKQFLQENDINLKPPKNILTSTKLNGIFVVFTGTRNKDLIQHINDHSGVIEKQITKKTTHLIMDSIDSKSSKYIKALKQSIEILNSTEFVNKYIC